MDSPLNKAGKLQVRGHCGTRRCGHTPTAAPRPAPQVYIQTTTNVCIEVNPHLRVPRTYKRFAGLMGTRGHPLPQPAAARRFYGPPLTRATQFNSCTSSRSAP